MKKLLASALAVAILGLALPGPSAFAQTADGVQSIDGIAAVVRRHPKEFQGIAMLPLIDTKLALCELCSELEVDWIKTSTGFGPSGATREDLELMLDNTPPHVQVKASGGIRELEQVLELRALGVSRIGSSSTQSILDAWKAKLT